MRIHMQRPSGGCTNCGGYVHTLKGNKWVCWKCEKEMDDA